jgi:hypothetical protein
MERLEHDSVIVAGNKEPEDHEMKQTGPLAGVLRAGFKKAE